MVLVVVAIIAMATSSAAEAALSCFWYTLQESLQRGADSNHGISEHLVGLFLPQKFELTSPHMELRIRFIYVVKNACITGRCKFYNWQTLRDEFLVKHCTDEMHRSPECG